MSNILYYIVNCRAIPHFLMVSVAFYPVSISPDPAEYKGKRHKKSALRARIFTFVIGFYVGFNRVYTLIVSSDYSSVEAVSDSNMAIISVSEKTPSLVAVCVLTSRESTFFRSR